MKLLPDSAASLPVIAVVGAGPAGLMAAQACADAGARVEVFDAMPSVGRKLLLAGKGGLNLTHAQAPAAFNARYAGARQHLQPFLDAFGPAEVRAWAHSLGIETFVGTSARVFPREMKAAPLLRAWLQRLRLAGVVFHSRHRWVGWLDPPSAGAACATHDGLIAGECDGSRLPDAPSSVVAGSRIGLKMALSGGPGLASGTRQGPAGHELAVWADAVILALGGGSWSRLGSDGAWLPLLSGRGVAVAPLAPANCGFDCGWSPHFSTRFAGAPMKSVAIALAEPCSGQGADVDDGAPPMPRLGEFVITATGVEGSLIYAVSAGARDRIAAAGHAELVVDLLPDRSEAWIGQALARPRGARSMANHLRRCLGIDGAKAGLLRECLAPETFADAERLAAAIKRLPVRLLAPRPLDEAISSAGGVRFDSLDGNLMLNALPGVFCAGEMLDWEAPTGGYLLTACLSTGRAAGEGALAWLAR